VGGRLSRFLLPLSRTPTSVFELIVVAQEVGGRLYRFLLAFSRTPTSVIESFVEEQ
jgi:hypothetical protein